MRLAAAVFVAAHGVGYSIWFMSTWLPSVMGTKDSNLTLPASAPATGPVGRTLGILALAVLVGFVASAWGIWQQVPWWPASLISSAVVATPIALLMWNPVGVVSVPATVANVCLVAATVMPWGEQFLGAR